VSQQLLPLEANRGPLPESAVTVAPGAVWVPAWLDAPGQAELLAACRDWARPPAGLRRPRMPNGAPFSTRAVCLGWHWYPYRYSRTCDDHDGAPVKPFPDLLRRLGHDACAVTGYAPAPLDAAIVNVYDPDAQLGLHQDDTEGDAVAAGSPVVTISLGDTCQFRFGGTETRNRPHRDVELASGDLFVFGGPSRLAFHGVPKVRGGTGPTGLGLTGRISVTLRVSGATDS
jgi:alkylated DNA repair protein (DNA oxidative demethylase)